MLVFQQERTNCQAENFTTWWRVAHCQETKLLCCASIFKIKSVVCLLPQQLMDKCVHSAANHRARLPDQFIQLWCHRYEVNRNGDGSVLCGASRTARHQWRRNKFPSLTVKRVSQLSMRFMCLLTVPVASFECKQILKREYLYSLKF